MLTKTNLRFHPLTKRIIGFANVGLLMTALSAGVLFVLLEQLQWQVHFAYASVYLITILISYLLNAKLVFKKSFSWVHLGAFYLAYFSGMLFGLAMITLLKSSLDYSDFTYSCFVLPLTVAWNFVLATKIFDKLRASLQHP